MTSRSRIIIGVIVFCAASSILVNSCRKSDAGRRTTPLSFTVPDGFPQPVYDFSTNPSTEEGFQLGKKLFYDSRLASHNDVSCGSCHQQLAAYTTFDHDLGHGTNHQHTTRNVPGIFNMVWQKEFEWDGRVNNLEQQMITCITAPEKMGMTVETVINKIDTVAEYKTMFNAAFGDGTITGERIAKALTQFVGMIVSANSTYDKMKRGEASFNSSQLAGYELFKSHCTSCHTEPLFTDFTYRNIGLPHRNFHEDAGRMRVTGSASDSLKFKVPSLRNVGITSYYAHDGRFAGITEVLDHYTSGIVSTPTLDPLLQSPMQLTNLEKFYIMEFLFTLNDSAMVADRRFSAD